jgi:hypothetical protein
MSVPYAAAIRFFNAMLPISARIPEKAGATDTGPLPARIISIGDWLTLTDATSNLGPTAGACAMSRVNATARTVKARV